MRFNYKSYDHDILRPVIPIQIIHKSTIVFYEVLIDSGADSNIFSSDIADIFGIDILQGEEGKVAGITGESRKLYYHYLDLRIGGILYKDVKVGFLREMGEYAYGVVGQKGFFDIFVVKFDLVKKEIDIKPRKQKYASIHKSYNKS